MQAYNHALPQFKQHGGQLVAISGEVPDSSLSLKEKHELGFQVLSDVGNRVAREFGIVYTLPVDMGKMYSQWINFPAYYGHDRIELPLAVTYIIAPDRTIEYAFLEADYTKRAEPADIVKVLNDLQYRH